MFKNISFILVAMLFVISGNAYSYSITFDEASFYSTYQNPTEVIDFTSLKDGTAYADADLSHPYINIKYSGSNPQWDVWNYGWSDNYSIFLRRSGGQINLVTRWDGNSITDGVSYVSYRLGINALNGVSPLALQIISDTYSGFVGIIPDSSTDTFYELYYPNWKLDSIQAGFSVAPVPIPPALWLFGTGLLMVISARKRLR